MQSRARQFKVRQRVIAVSPRVHYNYNDIALQDNGIVRNTVFVVPDHRRSRCARGFLWMS